MTKRRALSLAAAAALCACRGAIPRRNAPPEQGMAAVLVGGRMALPSGEARDGWACINFESRGGRGAESYRLPIKGGENFLYLVEPGVYRLAPTRSIFGFHEETMRVVVDGQSYRTPFPRELLRAEPYDMRPSKIVVLGVLEIRVMPALPGRRPEVRVSLDDSAAARRGVVQSLIRDMMDATRPQEARDSTVAWSRALQNALMSILTEEGKRPLYTPAP